MLQYIHASILQGKSMQKQTADMWGKDAINKT